MGGKIAVFTKDAYLFLKIKADIGDGYEVIMAKSEADAADAAVLFWDTDTYSSKIHGAVTMSRINDCRLKIPFALGAASDFLNKHARPISVNAETRTVSVYGAFVKLTELEFMLFDYLYNKGGEFASRSELLSSIWKNTADSGIINVYIHYLREKLEFGGEKIIISSRKFGYKIDRRFIGGKWDA